MNAPARALSAERSRRQALWLIRSELLTLANDADAIARMSDAESDAALARFDTALEGVRDSAKSLVREEGSP